MIETMPYPYFWAVLTIFMLLLMALLIAQRPRR